MTGCPNNALEYKWKYYRYEVHFDTMEQLNTSTGCNRRILRAET